MTAVAGDRPRLALDENFPLIVLGAAPLVPEVEIVRLRDIDPRLVGLADRRLIVALHQLGCAGLITNNYRMLNVPQENAALLRTKLTLVAVSGVGDDPLRATGSLMVDLPLIARRMLADGPRGHVFLRRPNSPRPDDAWSYFRKAAEHRGRVPRELYDEVKVGDDELTTPVLG